MNQKSLDKKKTEPKKLECWEERFDNEIEMMSVAKFSTEGIIKNLKQFIQSLIQSTKEETIKKVMGLECMKEIKFKFDNSYPRCVRPELTAENELRNQIKEQLNSLLKK